MTANRMSPVRRKNAHRLAGLIAVGLVAIAAGVEARRTAGANDPAAKAAELGAVTGVWTGEYRYPEGSGARPVSFTAIVVQRGEKLTGEIKEPNTFGEQGEPWLHATLEGRFEKDSRSLTFTKTYDGTGGVSHQVFYKGRLAANSRAVEEGGWKIQDNWEGTFTLKKKEHLESKKKESLERCVGVWKGEYRYPEGTDVKPVSFTLLLVPQGDRLAGEIKEPNTFGEQGAPWLHATVEGRFDLETRTLSFLKTYDGTAKVDHDVRYEGRVSADATQVEDGTWKIPDDGQGTFTLKKESAPQ